MLCGALRFLSVHIFINILLKHVLRRYRHVLACLLLRSLYLSFSLLSPPSSLSFYLRLFLSQLAQRFLFLQLFTHFGFDSFFFLNFKCKAVEFNIILLLFVLYLDLWARMYLHVVSKSTLLRQQRSLSDDTNISRTQIFSNKYSFFCSLKNISRVSLCISLQ